MFHFGLPSEKLNQDICPSNTGPIKQRRHNKLLYIGSGTDPLPLPVAKSAIFADILYSKRCECDDSAGAEKCELPKCIIRILLEKVKSLYVVLKRPVVTWYTVNKRPVAKVVFEWGDMPFLTQHGDKTVLNYIFGMEDYEFGTSLSFKSFSTQVDIIWLCGYGPSMRSFRHINFRNVDLAVGYNHLYLPKALKKHCQNYYYIEHLKLSDMFLRQSFKRGHTPHWPKGFNFLDLRFLLGCTMSFKAQNILDLQRDCDMFNNSNNPFKYLKFCSADEMYKITTDPTLVPYQCCDKGDDCPWLEVVSDPHGWTNIHMAAEQGDLGMVKALVKKTLNPNAPDDLGNTPISLAKHYSHVDVVNFLEDFFSKNKNLPIPQQQEASRKG